MNLADKPVPSLDVVTREMNGEIMLLDLASGTYFGLNEAGAMMWQALEAGEPLSAAAERIAAEYAVERGEAEADVLSLAEELVAKGLLGAVVAS